MPDNKKNQLRHICTCNKVSADKINLSIARGCNTMAKIFSATTAGIGECGGSCRPTLEKMLNHYVEKGHALKDPKR